MKPVDKGEYLGTFSNHKDAKPELVARLGEFCSYCECHASPQQLHVEHIYPQKPHPEKSKEWDNFLLACATCNTYKRYHLGDGIQSLLNESFLWPHLDNTFNAFKYHPDGLVTVESDLSPDLIIIADATLDMCGSMRSPAVTTEYRDLGIAYDGIEKRCSVWEIAERALEAYEENPSENQLNTVCDNCYSNGYFSIWMEIFEGYPEVRKALINKCKAAPSCFDSTMAIPIPRGRL
jgi:uncharacterized protein (TIGR02646 family)